MFKENSLWRAFSKKKIVLRISQMLFEFGGNTILFVSSVFHAAIHMFSMKPSVYSGIVAAGLVTSIINHGGFMRIGRALDRFVVRLAFATDLAICVYIGMHREFFLLVLSGSAYLVSKYLQHIGIHRESTHVLSHGLATAAHISMSSRLHEYRLGLRAFEALTNKIIFSKNE